MTIDLLVFVLFIPLCLCLGSSWSRNRKLKIYNAKRRAPVYSRALLRIKEVVQKSISRWGESPTIIYCQGDQRIRRPTNEWTAKVSFEENKDNCRVNLAEDLVARPYDQQHRIERSFNGALKQEGW